MHLSTSTASGIAVFRIVCSTNCIYHHFSLIKEEAYRPKYTQLLETKFVRKYESANVDVAGFVSRVLDAGQLLCQQKQWVKFDGNGN